MSKGRCMRWHPETDIPQIFEDESLVPPGWLGPPNLRPKTPVEPAVAEVVDSYDPLPLSRSEIIAALKERNIAFRVTAKTPILYALLMTAVERESPDE